MDTKHPLYEVPEAEVAKIAAELEGRVLGFDGEEVNDITEPDPSEKRGYNKKNWMRNKPCPCGSGRKFKRCCWRHYIK